jgi:CRP-like cAMP-binding protein
VAKRLLVLSSGYWDKVPREGAALPGEFTQADIASLSGGSREKVNRILIDFERRGMIRRDHKRYVLTNVKALERLAGI